MAEKTYIVQFAKILYRNNRMFVCVSAPKKHWIDTVLIYNLFIIVPRKVFNYFVRGYYVRASDEKLPLQKNTRQPEKIVF